LELDIIIQWSSDIFYKPISDIKRVKAWTIAWERQKTKHYTYKKLSESGIVNNIK